MEPKCSVCGEELEDWQGNVLVPDSDFEAGIISKIRVVCKPCTRRLDEKRVGEEWHNIWELHWLKESTIHYLCQVMSSFVDERPMFTWEKDAVEAVCRLAALAHPDSSRSGTEQLLSRLYP